MDLETIKKYLEHCNASVFINDIEEAKFSGLSDMEILSSIFAKLCYKSFCVGNNKNITKIRNISDNIKGCFDTKHGSVFEHVCFNFIISDCSRIFTHELVRHRVGTAFSQHSGRYIRDDLIRFVKDPDLEYSKIIEDQIVSAAENYDMLEEELNIDNCVSFDERKRLTSSIRRILPNGIANDIAFSVNVRELRHVLCMRTSRHAEWEMRFVFDKVYELIKDKYGLFLHGLTIDNHNGLVEITEG
jgi:thymidylate synthase (FAD)